MTVTDFRRGPGHTNERHPASCRCEGTDWLDSDTPCPGPEHQRRVPATPELQRLYADQSDRIAQAYYAGKAFPFSDHIRDHRGKQLADCLFCRTQK